MGFKCHDCSNLSAKRGHHFYADSLSYVCKINTKISSNGIVLNIFKTNDEGKTHLSPKNKISENFHVSRDQIPLKDRSSLASSISVNIHFAHPGHEQN